uniref:Uncharacterized protein n=1 Tax=Aegilops tauschii subsp. strangulata TaxID=200361 RepID=A0A453H8F7_AEGTS
KTFFPFCPCECSFSSKVVLISSISFHFDELCRGLNLEMIGLIPRRQHQPCHQGGDLRFWTDA